MDDNKNLSEVNVQRLLRAGVGGVARPEESARRRTLAQLQLVMRANRPVDDFPLAALVCLVGVMLIFALLLLSNSEVQAGIAVALLLGLNLLWIPIASLIIIVQRRQNVHKN